MWFNLEDVHCYFLCVATEVEKYSLVLSFHHFNLSEVFATRDIDNNFCEC